MRRRIVDVTFAPWRIRISAPDIYSFREAASAAQDFLNAIHQPRPSENALRFWAT